MIKNVTEGERFPFRIPRVLKYLFWVVTGLGTFVGLLYLWVAVSTASPAKAADKFLAEILSGDITEAYKLVSSSFSEEQTQERFVQELMALRPVHIELKSWKDRVLQRNGFSLLSGTLQTEAGETIPITVQMLNEDEDWKVLAMVDHARRSVGPGVWFEQVPVESEVRRLVEESLLAMNDAVQVDDFGDFSSIMPRAIRIPSKKSEIGRSFDKLVEQQVDYSDIVDRETVFTEPPYLFEQKVCAAFGGGCRSLGFELVVTGFYPRDGDRLEFTLMYMYDHPDWVLACGLERWCIVEVRS